MSGFKWLILQSERLLFFASPRIFTSYLKRFSFPFFLVYVLRQTMSKVKFVVSLRYMISFEVIWFALN